ncbi:MAG: High-affnity carbon uptake protein Hat/HatR, partial [Cyclobacteriaceae bacterium]
MLNYSVQVGEFEDEAPDPQGSDGGLGFNPFPGLRPFSIDESHLNFGREGQVDDILVKLSQHRSVTVMGYSGSGKSSLMHCGLVPVLYGGFMTQTGPHWHVIAARPSTSPIVNLANSIIDYQISINQIDETDREIHRAIITSVLRSGPDGLVEVAKYIQSNTNENIFFLIDQFEELFRYDESIGDQHSNDATAYVNLILNAVHQTKVPVYIAITMRSDFIGDCATFTGLTQMINASNYLVPQMTREQKRMAIEGPIAVGGGRISPRLVKKLLADIDKHQDQLPILQHALMRAWDYWVDNREPGEPMDVRHYNAIGKIEQALSLHANEAFDELTSKEKEIAEVLFKNVTEKGDDNTGMRRPCKVGSVAEIAEAKDEEVISVVERFRKPGRSFLMPDSSVQLDGSSVVELSHESIMRIWTRLSAWVDEESESSQTYKRISEAAAMYQIGKTGLWRPPDLQLALNWQKKQRPTRAWAQRYDIAFERAIVFLDTSRITYEAELKNQELLQKRTLRRARTTNIVLVIFLLISIAFLLFGITQQIAAEREALNAKAQEKIALEARDEANEQRLLAEAEAKRAEEALARATRLTVELSEQIKIANEAKAQAEASLKIAEEQRKIAESQTEIANSESQRAQEQFNRAEAALKDANRLLYLSVAQSMEAKVGGIDDAQLAGLLAMQGYLFHTKFDGKRYDSYVFSGLYDATAKLSGLNYNALFVPGNLRNRMYALAVSKNSNTFYTTGNDGRIFSGDYIDHKMGQPIGANPFPNRVLELSNDERYLVNGSDSSFIQIFILQGGKNPVRVAGHKGL